MDCEEVANMAGAVGLMIWLVGIIALVWAVREHLSCLDRIAAALERRERIQVAVAPDISAPR